MKTKKIIAMILALMMVLSLAACSNSDGPGDNTESKPNNQDLADDKGQIGGTIEGEAATGQVANVVVALTTGTVDLAPFGSSSGARQNLCCQLYAGLMSKPYRGATLDELEPWIAEKVEKVDDYTYNITLRENVYDSKGNHITADDVIWSYEMMYAEGGVTSIGTTMESLDKVDEYHLVMKLKTYGKGAIEGLLANSLNCIVSREWYENATADERSQDPAVTGAYRIASVIPGAQYVFEAVENYWISGDIVTCAKQNVKTITYKVIAEDAMRTIALENHEVDISAVASSELGRFYVDGQVADGYNVLQGGGTTFTGIYFNMDEGMSPVADNENLRKAILYALNSEDLLFARGNNLITASVCHTFGSSMAGGYNPNWTNEDYYNYNLEKAKEYMEASGYKAGELTLRLLGKTGWDSFNAIVLANLKAIGIEVELMAYDQALFNSYKFDSTAWDMMVDIKGTGDGYVAGGWFSLWNPDGYSNGDFQFNHSEELVRLVTKAYTSDDQADTDAVHYFLVNRAVGKGIYETFTFNVSQSGILELVSNTGSQILANACVYAADYKSVAD